MQTLLELLPHIGRLHMVVLHLPIGLLIGLIVLEVLVRWRSLDALRPAVRVMVILTAISAVTAAGLGYLLTFEEGFDIEGVFWHQWLGILMAAFSVLACWLYLEGQGESSRFYHVGYGLSLVAMIVLMPITSHLGGEMVHGPGYLTEGYAQALGFSPPPGSAPADDNAPIDPGLEYATVIQPILEARCIQCHRPGKQKGNLRLDIPAGMTEQRGDDPPVIYPYDALGSELVYRITLPEGDRDRMPPGHHDIPADEVLAIIHWINRGAQSGEAADPGEPASDTP